jgi:Ca-activated chloride channel family protein
MSEPRIEIIPAKAAVGSDAAVVLEVLVRVTPPQPEVHFPRPPLNLALVLDRSGSMAGSKKMPFAREAASFVVRQLLPTDRVSVTVFDDRIETIVPNAPAADKPGLVRRIEQVGPRGSTDLHGGWVEGGRQAESQLAEGGINRVLLLTDGLANVGVTDPNTIATEARGLAARGVGTTTLGVGDDYNEDLLEAMASAGDGHYYFIESPAQLVDIFQTELHGLMAMLGQKVSLGLEPCGGAAVSDVLNDFEKAPTGRLMLPNLVVGMPVLVLVRLNVPPRPTAPDLLEVRLAWDDPREVGRRVARAALGWLPGVPLADWSALPVHPEVAELSALLMSARAQRESARAHERGDLVGSASYLAAARAYTAAAPPSPATVEELAALADLQEALDDAPAAYYRKLAKFRSHLRQRSQSPRPSPPPPPAAPDPPAGAGPRS